MNVKMKKNLHNTADETINIFPSSKDSPNRSGKKEAEKMERHSYKRIKNHF